MSDSTARNSSTNTGTARTSERAVHMQSSTTTSSSTQNSSSSSSSSSTTTSSSNSFLSQAKLTLKRGTILHIEWATAAHDVEINLNQYVAFTGGQLRWTLRDKGGFRKACEPKTPIDMEGTFLVASCREGESGAYQQARLDLSAYIKFNTVTKVFEPEGLDFSNDGAEKFVASSRSLLDVTLISSFNVAKLLSDPAFSTTITEVAERAEKNAQNQREEVVREMSKEVEEIRTEVNELRDKLEKVASRAETAMNEMKTQLDSISQESSQRFQQEMTTLVDRVAAMTLQAVYAQIREMTVLNMEQQKAYATYWPPSPPPAYNQSATTGSV